jgi:hypothetical protein
VLYLFPVLRIFCTELLTQTQVNGPFLLIVLNDGVKGSNYVEVKDRVNINELRKKYALCPNLRYSPAICFVELRIPSHPFPLQQLSQATLPPDQDLNPRLPANAADK